MLTDMVRTDSHQLRAVAGDSPGAGAVKVVARAHKTLIWERTRHVQRLRHQLREYFPAALEAFDDLDAPDALQLLGKAPDPAKAARLIRAQISAALKRARRRDIPGKATVIMAALRGAQLGPAAGHHRRLFRPDISPVGADRASVMRCCRLLLIDLHRRRSVIVRMTEECSPSLGDTAWPSYARADRFVQAADRRLSHFPWPYVDSRSRLTDLREAGPYLDLSRC